MSLRLGLGLGLGLGFRRQGRGHSAPVIPNVLTASRGSFLLTGNDAILRTSLLLSAAAGAFAMSGQAAIFTVQRNLQAAAASFALTGNDAALTKATPGAFTLLAGAGAFVITGDTMTPLVDYKLPADAGAFVMTGQAAGLVAARKLTAAAGSFSLTGQDATLTKSGGALVLDGITTGIKAAYSTRKLLTTYAGSAIQVQRLSDNTTLNIGFVANALDTASLATFCSGTTGVVSIWYDQSGGGFDQTAAASAAPIIYQTGATNTLNGKPAILGNTSGTLLTNASLTANPVNTLYQNAIISWTSGDSGISGGNAANGALEWRVDLGTGILELLKASVASIGTSSISVTTATGALVEAQYNSSTGAFSFWVNRSAAGTGTSAQTLTAGNVKLFSGYGSNNDSFNGSIGEVIMYDLVGGIPGASQTSITANQSSYWGTP